MPSRRFLLRILAAVFPPTLVVSGCDAGTLSTTRGTAGPPGSDAVSACVETRCDEPPPTSRFPRLSHPQWENATRDLLGLDAPSGLSRTFVAAAPSGLFDNVGSELSVDEVQWTAYQAAAEELARRVVSSPALLARVAPDPGGTSSEARARAFIVAFGRRAHRRALSEAEVTRYEALFARGPSVHGEHDDFTAGVQLVLEAMLQSPHFLYRIERPAADVTAPALAEHASAPLDGDSLASRLSFALWNTIPDEELFRAASAGELGDEEGLRTQARRMLADPRARDTVLHFHDQLFDTQKDLEVVRATSVFPEFTPGLPAAMREETRRFVAHVVFEERGGLARLLTAPYTFVNADLARIYRVPEPEEGFARVALDPTERAGILTQIGPLASNAVGIDSDPIHRGLFVARRIVCAPLPPPPMSVPPLPADDPARPTTMREKVTRHTGPGTCGATCHGNVINPLGFAFEHFDSLGRFRTSSHGAPVDAASEIAFGSERLVYDGAPELARVLAQQTATHQCYVQHWLEALHGRHVTDDDGPAIVRLAAASVARDLSVQDLIVELVAAPSFRQLSTQPFDETMNDEGSR